MIAKEIQKRIEQTDYWDRQVYDFSCFYFCDEVVIEFEKDDNSFYRLSLKGCTRVHVDIAEGARWHSLSIREMKQQQLGFYLQTVEINDAEIEGYVDVSMDLSMLSASIRCSGLEITQIERSTREFFWETI